MHQRGTVTLKIKSECSRMQWKESVATLGRFDLVDIVEANDPMQIEKAAMIIRAYRRDGNAISDSSLRGF